MRGFRSGLTVLAAGLLLGLGHPAAADKPVYKLHGSCGGLPRIAIETAPGYCLGLVAGGLRFPRGLLPLADGRILVAEMAGWGSARGRIAMLAPDGKGAYVRSELLRGLPQPHGLALGPDGKVYIGVVGGVKRFDLAAPAASLEDVIGGRAAVPGPPGDGRHPLVSLLFTDRGTLLINVGSYSNNCETEAGDLPAPAKPCPETLGEKGHGQVREYDFDWSRGTATGWRAFAAGLRNSLGLAQNPASKVILQAENARDDIDQVMPDLASDEDLPPDEINLLEAGRDYGWPYCYGDRLTSPEYAGWDCSATAAPVTLLPAHAAPLGLAWWQGGLVVGFHGYRRNGHRLVRFPVDAQGLPNGPLQDLVLGWDSPEGAPVDLRVGPDGALYVSEDRNGTVLRLIRE